MPCRRALPLLRLAFHPVPLVRQLAAELLYCLTFVPATEQWLSLPHPYLGTVSQPAGPLIAAVPAPFAKGFMFPLDNMATLSIAPFGVEHEEAQELCTEVCPVLGTLVTAIPQALQ